MSAIGIGAAIASSVGKINSQIRGQEISQRLLGIADRIGQLKAEQARYSPGTPQHRIIEGQLQKLQQQEKSLSVAKEHANAMSLAYSTLDESNQNAVKEEFEFRKRLIANGALG